MNEILHANLFFIIASTGFVLMTIIICLILWQVLKSIKSLRRIIERIDAGSEMIAEDMSQFRSFVAEGSLVSQLIGFFMGHKKRSRRKKDEVYEDYE